MATCRVCGKGEEAVATKGGFVRYGPRHYAHASCGLEKHGAAFFERLALWPLERFPALFAYRAGLLEELKQAICERRAAQCAEERGHGG
jgi:hypothetical protein